jgi:hypothetical protein
VPNLRKLLSGSEPCAATHRITSRGVRGDNACRVDCTMPRGHITNPPKLIHYMPEVPDSSEPDGRLIVGDWSDESSELVDGDVILTPELDVVVEFSYDRLPDVNLHSDRGFTRRAIVNIICNTLMVGSFKYDHSVILNITVNGDKITFSLSGFKDKTREMREGEGSTRPPMARSVVVDGGVFRLVIARW